MNKEEIIEAIENMSVLELAELVEELEDTLSKSVRELIKQDLDEILEENLE